MLQTLWQIVRRMLGLDAGWEVMTLSRVAIDPVSARGLTRVLQPAHTIRLRPEPAAAGAAERIDLTWHGITDTGMTRTQNEDSLAFGEREEDAYFVIADGMGGHDAGEVASGIAVAAVEEALQSGPGQDPRARIGEAVRKANEAVRSEAVRTGSNMGTTLTAALVRNGVAHIASVGDSRAYWISGGTITRVTRDHSLVGKLMELGRLTEEEARTDPRANLLLRTIGSEDAVDADSFRVPLSRGGTLLLCTDGLWGEVTDGELLRICTEEERSEVICARLVQEANRNGGKDNITAIVVKVS